MTLGRYAITIEQYYELMRGRTRPLTQDPIARRPTVNEYDPAAPTLLDGYINEQMKGKGRG